MAKIRIEGSPLYVQGTDEDGRVVPGPVRKLARDLDRASDLKKARAVCVEVISVCRTLDEFQAMGVELVRSRCKRSDWQRVESALVDFFQSATGEDVGALLEYIVSRWGNARAFGFKGRLTKLLHCKLLHEGQRDVMRGGRSQIDHGFIFEFPSALVLAECKASVTRLDERSHRQLKYLAACRIAMSIYRVPGRCCVVCLDREAVVERVGLPRVAWRIEVLGLDFVRSLLA